MRTTFTVLSLAAIIAFICCQSAGAVAINAAAIRQTAAAPSAVQQAQYYERHTRYHVTKCYRELVVGPYVCHRFHRW